MVDESVVEQKQVMHEGKEVFPSKDFNIDTFKNGAIYDDEIYDKVKNESVVEKVSTPVVEATTETSGVVDFNVLLKEKTGGKFENWETLAAKLEEKPEIKFENESSKTVFEYLKDGKMEDLEQFLLTRKALRSAETASDEDVVKMYMQINEPDADMEDVADDFNAKFEKPQADDFESDEAYNKAVKKYDRLIKKEATTAREFMKKSLEDLKLPELTKEPEHAVQDIEGEVNAVKSQISEAVASSLKNINEIEVKVDNKDIVFSHKYTFTDTEKQEALKAAEDYFSYFDGRYAKDGKYDGNQLALDILKAQNGEKITQAAITEAISKERLSVINNIANHKKEETPEGADAVKNAERQNLVRFLLS